MSTTSQTSAGKRIDLLLDDNSFVEIGGLVKARNTDFNMLEADTPADGVITGYGTINGGLVYVYSQDSSVMSGSMGEMHAKKIVNIYDMALKMGAPVIGFIDCAGLRLQEATDALNAFGEIYAKQAEASGVIPQISAVMGTCGGGMAIAAALSDFTFMESRNARLFVNSPNTLEGCKTDRTATAEFQAGETAVVDFTGDEASIITEIRNLISILPSNNEDEALCECTDDLNRICSGIADCSKDPAYVLPMISDDGLFVEVKKSYAEEMVTGFIKLNGTTVGVVANRTEIFENGKSVKEFEKALTAEGCNKASEMIKFCDAFEIPVLSITDVRGFLTCESNEKAAAKAAAGLVYAFASADVPKVNLITGEAYGSAYTIMNSKAAGADITFAWEDAEVGMMDAGLAARIMYEKQPELISEKADEYKKLQNGAVSAAGRGYVDSVIKPEDTRKYLISSFEMLYSKKISDVYKKHGTI